MASGAFIASSAIRFFANVRVKSSQAFSATIVLFYNFPSSVYICLLVNGTC